MTGLSPDRWREVRRLLDEVIELDPPARGQILRRPGIDPETLSEVENLLKASDAAPSFLESAHGGPSGEMAGYASLARGTRVGAFAIDGLVGRGGHGEVYRAVRADGAFDQVVALKLLRPEAASFIGRFEAERRILASLEHPGIARLIDGGTAPDGRPFAVMEFVEGTDIDSHCASEALDLNARLLLFKQVCDAVAYAHRHLVVHRDLKPSNIQVTRQGQVKLLDFGIARLIAETDPVLSVTEALSTPAYAAPEQLEGKLPTTSTDVYALGVVLFGLLTGRNPWQPQGSSAPVMLRRILEQDTQLPSKFAAQQPKQPVPPDVLRGDLDAIVMQAMRPEPEQRYENATMLWDDIDRSMTFRPVTARAGARGYIVRRFLRRNRGPIAAASALVLALALGGTGIGWQMRQTELQRQASREEASRADAASGQAMLMLRASASAQPGQARALLEAAAQALIVDLDTEKPVDPLGPFVLAEYFMQMELPGDAEELLSRALKRAERQQDIATAARATQGIAGVRLSQGNLVEARRLLATATAVWLAAPVRNARDLREARALEAALLRQEGKPDQAIRLLSPLAAEADDSGGPNSTEGTVLLHNLGVHLIEAGRLDEASRTFDDAWRRTVARGQEVTPIGLSVRMNRAGIAFRRGHRDEAEAAFRAVIKDRLSLFGPSLGTAAAQMNLARILVYQERYDEALALLDDARELGRSLVGEKSEVFIGVDQSRASVLLALERLPEAERQIEANLAAAQDPFGNSRLYKATSLALRARLRLLQGRLDEAAADLDAADAKFGELGESGKASLVETAILRSRLTEARAKAKVQALP